MRLIAVLLLVVCAAKGNMSDEEHEKKLTDSEAHAKPIQIKDFEEDSKDDRMIHFTMSPDHDCVNGICSDGDFMLTDMPDFSEIHIHSRKHSDAIVVEEYKDGTTVEAYIGEMTTTEVPPAQRQGTLERTEADTTSAAAPTTVETTMVHLPTTSAPTVPTTGILTTMVPSVEIATTPGFNSETTIENDASDETTTQVDILVGTTTEADELGKTTTETDFLIDITTKEDVVIETSTEKEELLETTTVKDEVMETTTKKGEFIETTTENDDLMETTTEKDVLYETSTTKDIMIETTTANDVLIDTTTVKDELMETTTDENILFETSTSKDILIETNTVKDVLIDTTTVKDELMETTTEKDVLFETSTAKDILIESTTANDVLIDTTTVKDELMETTTEEIVLFETSTSKDILIDTTTANDVLIDTTTVKDELMETTTDEDVLFETSTAKDILIETTTANDVLIETTTVKDELNETSTEEDILFETSTAKDIIIETTTANDVLIDTITVKDELMEITTEKNVVFETTESSTEIDASVETTTQLDILVETTAEAHELGETTTEKDVLFETTESSTEIDASVETTTQVDILIETTTEADELGETTTETDFLMDLTTNQDVLIEITTEKDELIETITIEKDIWIDTTTDTDVLVKTTTGASVLLDTTTNKRTLIETTTDTDIIIETTTDVDLLTTTLTDVFIENTTTLNTEDEPTQNTLPNKSIETTTVTDALETTTVDDAVETTTITDNLETTTETNALETTTKEDALVETTTLADTLSITPTKLAETVVETTIKVGTLIETTTAQDILIETTTELDIIIETTTLVDALIETTKAADHALETKKDITETKKSRTLAEIESTTLTLTDAATESNMVVSETTTVTDLSETISEEDPKEEIVTTISVDEILTTSTEIDELVSTEAGALSFSTSEAGIILGSKSTESVEVVDTTTEADSLVATTTESLSQGAVITTVTDETTTVTVTDKIIATTGSVSLETTKAADVVIDETTDNVSSSFTTVSGLLEATTTVVVPTDSSTKDLPFDTTSISSVPQATTKISEVHPDTTVTSGPSTNSTAATDVTTASMAATDVPVESTSGESGNSTTDMGALEATTKGTVEAGVPLGTTIVTDVTTVSMEGPELSIVEATTNSAPEARLQDGSLVDGSSLKPVHEADDWSCSIKGEFEVINTFFKTPIVGSNSSISFIKMLLERDLGIMFEQSTPSTNRKNVEVTKVMVVESSSAFTRLRREVRLVSRVKRLTDEEATVLKVWFQVRMENISYTAYQSTMWETAKQILLNLPGILTHTLNLAVLPDCAPTGSLYGPALAMAGTGGCCLGTLCVTQDSHSTRLPITPFPPSIAMSNPAPCPEDEEACCSSSTQTSYPLIAKTITNSLVFLVQSTVDKQKVSQQMCSSSTCRGGQSSCKQAFGVTEVLAANASGEEYIAFVLVGNGCDCNEDEENTDATEVSMIGIDNGNEFEAIQNEGFDEVLLEVRQSYFKLLGMFFLSLSKEIVLYHNGVTDGLLRRFSAFENASYVTLDQYVEFVQRSEGSLGMSLREQDFIHFQNRSLSHLEKRIQSLKSSFDAEVSSITDRFENVLQDLIPLFEKLENYCNLVVHSSKTAALAKTVGEEFQEEYLRFEENLSNQVDLSIESANELKLYYHSQYSAIASHLLTDVMSSKFSEEHSAFVDSWRLGYASQTAMALNLFKDDFLEIEAKDLKNSLGRSLATISGDVSLLTECVKSSSLPYYEQSNINKKEVDLALQDSLERSFGQLSAELTLAVENMSNKTETFIEDAENLLENSLLNIQENLEIFNKTINELETSESLAGSAKEISILGRLATSVFNANMVNNLAVLENHNSFIQNVYTSSNITLANVQSNLKSKIDDEKNKLMKYIASNITDLSISSQISSIIDVIFSNIRNSSTEILNQSFSKYEALLLAKLEDPLTGDYSPMFNASVDVVLLANGLGPVLTQSDLLFNATLNKVLKNTLSVVDEFLLAGDYINNLANQALFESFDNKNQTNLVSFQTVMKIMKMWQEAQFSQLDSLLRSNQVGREELLDGFRQGLRDVLTKIHEVEDNVSTLLMKRLKLKLRDEKFLVQKALLPGTSTVFNQFFLEVKNNFGNTVSNIASNPEVTQYLGMMVDIIKMDAVKGVEMSVRETLGLLSLYNGTSSPLQILKSLSQSEPLTSEDINMLPTEPDLVSTNYSAADINETRTEEPVVDLMGMLVDSQFAASPDAIPSDDLPIARGNFLNQDDAERGTRGFGASSSAVKCKTSGGRDPGKECVFPFSWRGVKYYQCTREGRDGEWCPTQVHSSTGHTIEGRWGYCGQGCGDQHVQEEYSEDVPTLIKSLAAEIDRLKELVERVHADDLQTAPCVDSIDDTHQNSTAASSEEIFLPGIESLIGPKTLTTVLPQCSREGTCQGRCGKASRSSCSCDEICQDMGDCCCDRGQLCELTADGWVSRPENTTIFIPEVTSSPFSSSEVKITSTSSSEGTFSTISNSELTVTPTSSSESTLWSTPSSEVLFSPSTYSITLDADNFNVTSAPKKCIGTRSCSGRCGGGSASDCWCDEMCDNTDDCCCDREQVCQLLPTGWVEKVLPQVSSTRPETHLPTFTDLFVTPSGVASLAVPTCKRSGSCSGRCGGGSVDDCWCNDLCDERNDCCCDREELCDLTPLGWISKNVTEQPLLPSILPSLSQCIGGTCAGKCGARGDSGCWCDEICADTGDCCCDRDQQCELGIQGWVDRNITRPQTSSISPSFTTITIESLSSPFTTTYYPTTTTVVNPTTTSVISANISSGDASSSEPRVDLINPITENSIDDGDPITAINPTPSLPIVHVLIDASEDQNSSISTTVFESSPSVATTTILTLSPASQSASPLILEPVVSTTSKSVETIVSTQQYPGDVTTISVYSTLDASAVPSSSVNLEPLVSTSSSQDTESETVAFTSVASSQQGPEDASTITIYATQHTSSVPSPVLSEDPSILSLTVPEPALASATCRAAGSCSGRCGGGQESDCWCDESCPDSGDCCCDYQDMCGEDLGPSSTSTTSRPLVPSSSENSSIIFSSSSPLSPVAALKSVLPATLPKRCKTIAGPAPFHGCVFPFIHRSKTFTSCTTSSTRARPWCSTRVDSRQRFMGGFWGFCGPSCPKSIRNTTAVASPSAKPSHTRKPFIIGPVKNTSNNLEEVTEVNEIFKVAGLKDVKIKNEVGIETTSVESPAFINNSNSTKDVNPTRKPFITNASINNTGIASVESATGIASVESATGIASVESATGIAPVESATGIAPVESATGITPIESATGIAPVESDTDIASVSPGEMLKVTSADTVVDEGKNVDTASPSTESPIDENVSITTEGVTISNNIGSSFDINEPKSIDSLKFDADENSETEVIVSSNSDSVGSTSNLPSSVTDKLQSVLDEIAEMLNPRLGNYLQGDRGTANSLANNTSIKTSTASPTPATNTTTSSAPLPIVFVSNHQGSVPYIKTAPTKPRCLTWAGPEKEQKCIFPFTYRNKTFTGCTEFWRQKGWWCATQVDKEGQLNGAKWGLCQDNCPHDMEVGPHTVISSPDEETATEDTNYVVAEALLQEDCQTVSGVDPEQACKFPFTFHGKTYTSCTYSFGVDQPWCSTETDTAGQYVPGKWGYCSPQCPAQSNPIQECLTVAGPRPGNLCVFPFLTGSTLHWGCTSEDGGYWCPTKVDDHVEVLGDNWGWCKERCKEVVVDPCLNQTTTVVLPMRQLPEAFPLKQEENIPSLFEIIDGTTMKDFVTTEISVLDGDNNEEILVSTSSTTVAPTTATESVLSDESSSLVTTAINEVSSRESAHSTASSSIPLTTQSALPLKDLVPSELTSEVKEFSSSKSVFEEADLTTTEEVATTEADLQISTSKTMTTTTVLSTSSTKSELEEVDLSELEEVDLSTSQFEEVDLTTTEEVATTEVDPNMTNLLTTSTTVSSTSSTNKSVTNITSSGDSVSEEESTSNKSDLEEADLSTIQEMVTTEKSAQISSTSSVSNSITSSASNSAKLVTVQTTTITSTTDSEFPNFQTTFASSSVTAAASSKTTLSAASSISPVSLSTDSLNELDQSVENATTIPATTSIISETSSFNASSLFRSNLGCIDSGSCEGLCGGGSDYTCWCDTLCGANGDCCCDLETHCTEPAVTAAQEEATITPAPEPAPAQCLPGTCTGRCGGGHDQDCWCDEMCVYSGDCCCDLEAVCLVQAVPLVPDNVTNVKGGCSASASCEGRCGGGSDKNCWCDELCGERDDCCCDRGETCQAVTETSTEGYTVSPGSCVSGCGTDSSGPVRGTCCVFPFTHKGKRHNTCVEVDGAKAWCSTKVDQDGHYIPNKWGYCDDNCVFQTPSPHVDSQESSTNSTTMITKAPSTPGTVGTTTSPTLAENQDTTATVQPEEPATEPMLTNSPPVSAASTSTTLMSTTTMASTAKSTTTSTTMSTTTSTTESTTTSTTTSTTASTTTSTTSAPYTFVFQAKPSPYFLSQLPPANSVVSIPPTQYDPVRALLGDIF